MAEILGAEVDEEGYLLNVSDWTREIANAMSEEDGIELSPEHWEVINFLQDYYKEYEFAPAVRGLNSAFTVRKISHGEGVERVFQTHSSMIDSVSVKRSGKVRQAKLYYLRGLTGKAARIKEKLKKK